MSEPIDIQAIQGDPERTICLVVTISREVHPQIEANIREAVGQALLHTKWFAMPIFVVPPGFKIEAVEMPTAQAAELQAKQETWRDREPML